LPPAPRVRAGEKTIEEFCTSIDRRLWALITGSAPVVIGSHVRIDGDGLGASLALMHGLRDAGVECCAFIDSPVPTALGFLPGVRDLLPSPDALPERFGLVVLDCGSLARAGRLAEHAGRATKIFNIDHHATNDQFGDVNYVDPTASSSAEIVFRLLQAGGVALTPQIAENLYAGIVTDTGRFSYANTTAASLKMCGRLVEAGCRPQDLIDRVYLSPPQAVVRLQGLVIDTLRLEEEGRIATMEISREMFRRTGSSAVDTQGFAELPIGIRGVVLSALLKEMVERPGWVKVSLRGRASEDGIDVARAAESLGGGGHRYAAGCEVKGPLEEARGTVLQALRRCLKT